MSLSFLRPEWFVALLPLTGLAWSVWQQSHNERHWSSIIDARLIPHLLTSEQQLRGVRWGFWMTLLSAILIIVALAGPVWEKHSLPVFKQQSALVIAIDLSRSMDARDIRPSRLARARLKLIDLLKSRKEGQSALIAYAATPYTVSPLTDDSDTIQSLVSSLSTDIMPAQGSRTDLAIQHAQQLLQNAGQSQGDILLITDSINPSSLAALSSVEPTPYRVSVLSIGTAEGAPIPAAGGGFVKDQKGSIVIAKTNTADMAALAKVWGGMSLSMTLDDGDIQQLQQFIDGQLRNSSHWQTDFKADRWKEQGPWFLLPVLLLAAFAFRRGAVLVLVLIVGLFQGGQPVYAQEQQSEGWNWQRLWQNQGQRAAQAFDQGDHAQAAELFEDLEWKAAAHYHAGQFEQAQQQLSTQSSITSAYNLGNALAKMGRLEEALDAYDRVIERDASHEDAKYNRQLVEQALKQQQKQQQSQPQGSGDENSPQEPSSQNSTEDQQSGDPSSGEPEQGQDSSDPGTSGRDDSVKGSEAQSSDSSGDPADQSDTPQVVDPPQQPSQQSAQTSQPETGDEDASASPHANERSESQQQQELSQQAEAQWLRRIPDDPGGLLRNKFKYQYSRQPQPISEQEQW